MATRISKELLAQVVIGDMVERGRCIARVGDLVLFVAQVAPGDVADLRIVSKKKGYAEAVPVHIHSAGHTRVQPVCQHFGVCGGCQWQHVSYTEQLAAKERLVLEKLLRIGHLQAPHVAPILAANPTVYYRNKLEFTFSNKRWLSTAEIEEQAQLDRYALGFHRPGYFDKVVDIKHCHLQPAPSNAIRNTIAQFAKEHRLSVYDLQQHSGLLRNLIIRTTSTGEVMAIVQFGQAATDKIEQVMCHLQTQFPQLTSLQYVVNTKKNETFYDLPVHLYHGQSYITEQLNGLKFQIGPKSFFQTNTVQAQVLYRKIQELADLHDDEIVYDLYTGVGSIAIFLAQYVRHIVGIDVTEAAIADAQVNAKLNDVVNTTFVAGEVEQLLDTQFLSTHGKPHVIITDPPRAGMHPRVIKQLLHIAPERIVYVSCNPATQARDIALLDEQYRLVTAQPVDMFPHTSHVENIVLLTKQSRKAK
jgi:23S rRNA (uracil1939-C5)-methyltransferase